MSHHYSVSLWLTEASLESSSYCSGDSLDSGIRKAAKFLVSLESLVLGIDSSERNSKTDLNFPLPVQAG